MAWLPDGQIMALHIGVRSTLWRFQSIETIPKFGTMSLEH
jgi:hypothetical protein